MPCSALCQTMWLRSPGSATCTSARRPSLAKPLARWMASCWALSRLRYGPLATRLAVEHLGYVQIDTINVIERSHHHILFTRIPGYRRSDLQQAQSTDKSVFEYWTHALSFVPTRDYRFFMPAMRDHRTEP